ncbi:MAG: triose-phosphate isomerase [Bacteroidetes bacterium]|nr:MAG: triose-phosphate isomerase [Bacteroidota bacterium]
MRSKIVAGNWKMNKKFDEADELLFQISEELSNNPLKDVQLVVCPPSLYLELATDFAESSDLKIGAQNVSHQKSGAYTGELSVEMLNSVDVEYCIIGHSERRKYFSESSEMLAQKVDNLLEFGIEPIFCIGEQLDDREAGNHFDLVKKQLSEGLFHLSASEFSNIVVAYEPVWAIGTGVTASPEQAQEMHAFIRDVISEKYGSDIAEETTILYGGSCNAKNAKELFSNKDVDGGLIGGASLIAKDFITIANSF